MLLRYIHRFVFENLQYKYFFQYENIDDYKIGFNFSFFVGDEKIEKTILKPETYAFEPYFPSKMCIVSENP